MPVLDGYAVLHELRHAPCFADLKILALTAYAMHGDREKALQSGFDGYLTKPIDMKALTKEVQNFLDD